jgi:hypothetical protein
MMSDPTTAAPLRVPRIRGGHVQPSQLPTDTGRLGLQTIDGRPKPKYECCAINVAQKLTNKHFQHYTDDRCLITKH